MFALFLVFRLLKNNIKHMYNYYLAYYNIMYEPYTQLYENVTFIENNQFLNEKCTFSALPIVWTRECCSFVGNFNFNFCK